VIGLATFFSALAAGIWTLAVATVFGLPPTPWLPFVLLLAPPLLLTLAVFVALARAGRAAEQRRDLGG
jgi:hypothetical protein